MSKELQKRIKELDGLKVSLTGDLAERGEKLHEAYLELDKILILRLADLKVRVAGERLPAPLVQLLITFVITSLGLLLCPTELSTCGDGLLDCKAGDWWYN